MSEVVFEAKKRELVGKKAKSLRARGILPAVMYGRTFESTPISIEAREANRVLPYLSSSVLVKINLDGDTHTTLVREKQRDVILGDLLHVDFQVVSMTERIRANVSLDQVGVAPAVEEIGVILVTSMESVEVEAYPQDLPEKIEIDLSVLENVGDAIYVRDLDVGEDVTIQAEPDDVIVVVNYAMAEEEEEEEEEELLVDVGLEEPEVIERGKREEEEIEEEIEE